MKKLKLILMMILVSSTGLFAQTAYNPFTQNIHFVPEPTAAGFSCGSTPQVEFTQGITTADSATLWQTQPLQVTICITGFEFASTNAAAVVSGSYASNFDWAFDSFAPNCIIGTQNQTLYGTGSNPLFPDVRSSGLITLDLEVPATSPISTVLAVNVNLQVPGYMSTFNSTPDDNESTQTQTFCELKISGTVYNDTIVLNGTIDKELPLGNPDNVSLCASLVDLSTGLVVDTTHVANDGTYEFLNVTGFTTYEVVLSDNCGVIGNTKPTASLPNFWSHTGQDCCDGTGEDANNDGTVTVAVTNASVPLVDFGIFDFNPTPVVLTSFSVSEHNCNSLVSWATASEENVSHFEILRADETSGTFEKIAKLEASGNSTSQKLYNYIDKDVEKREEAYLYKIKFVDFDGSTEYSVVKSVKMTCGGTGVSAEIFPNPTSEALNLVYSTDDNDVQLVVDVIDITGRKLLTKSQIIFKGTTVINVDVNSLAAGQYLIRYSNIEGNTTGSIKFTKE